MVYRLRRIRRRRKIPYRRRRLAYGYRTRKRRFARRYSRRKMRYPRKDPFAQKFRTPLIYQEVGYGGSLNLGNGYRYTHSFRGNSIYDPDQSGIGVQPYFHDTFSEIYHRYNVHACKITVYLMTTTPLSSCASIKVCLFPSINTDASYAAINMANMSYLKYCKTMCFNINTMNGATKSKISNYATTTQIIDIDKKDPNLTGEVNANPATQYYWNLIVDTGDVGQACTVIYDVKIKYYVVFSGRRTKVQD